MVTHGFQVGVNDPVSAFALDADGNQVSLEPSTCTGNFDDVDAALDSVTPSNWSLVFANQLWWELVAFKHGGIEQPPLLMVGNTLEVEVFA